jgi:hypothetical protein
MPAIFYKKKLGHCWGEGDSWSASNVEYWRPASWWVESNGDLIDT